MLRETGQRKQESARRNFGTEYFYKKEEENDRETARENAKKQADEKPHKEDTENN